MIGACPKCGSKMELRIAERGKNAGGYFYGCTRYPLCHGTREKIDPNDAEKTRLPKDHPFIVEARRLERLEVAEGLSDVVLEGRIKLGKKYPEFFREYMKAKDAKQHLRLAGDREEKRKQMIKFGSETVSYQKMKTEELKKKNRANK